MIHGSRGILSAANHGWRTVSCIINSSSVTWQRQHQRFRSALTQFKYPISDLLVHSLWRCPYVVTRTNFPNLCCSDIWLLSSKLIEYIKNWKHAGIIYLFWLPLGVIANIYWVVVPRKKERPSRCKRGWHERECQWRHDSTNKQYGNFFTGGGARLCSIHNAENHHQNSNHNYTT